MNVEAYRRAQAAQAERRSRIRTRDGVVDLAEWRHAKQTEQLARMTFGGISKGGHIRVALAEDVGFVLEILVLVETPTLRYCLPSAVSDIPVRVVGSTEPRGAGR